MQDAINRDKPGVGPKDLTPKRNPDIVLYEGPEPELIESMTDEEFEQFADSFVSDLRYILDRLHTEN